MLPIKGDRCVLGRSPRFPPTMWSCLAGFCEPGESIEEAVAARNRRGGRRGLRAGPLFCVQPWPFPASLMIGCHAEAVSDEVVIDKSEIEDARWFDRAELNRCCCVSTRKSSLRRRRSRSLTTSFAILPNQAATC